MPENQIEYYSDIKIPSYLIDGFTITMWVKFMDKVNDGTLFNYGSPLRRFEPHGFTLETFVLNKDDYSAPIGALRRDGQSFFSDENTERFIRLVVREGDGSLRDSHTGTSWYVKQNTGIPASSTAVDGINDIPEIDNEYTNGIWSHTTVPIDFDEWYFVVASYNPESAELSSYDIGYDNDPEFWMGHVNPDDGAYVHKSGFGNRCKVEVISKSQLLRARGYKSQND